MMTRIVSLFAVLFVLLLLVAPVAAQEVTPAPEGGAVTVVEDGGGNTTVTVQPAPSVFDYLNTGMLVTFVVGGLLGAIAGGGSALAVLSRVDRQTKDNIEKLHEGLSPSWKSTIERVIDIADTATRTAVALVDLAKQVTDGQPNTDPPPAPLG